MELGLGWKVPLLCPFLPLLQLLPWLLSLLPAPPAWLSLTGTGHFCCLWVPLGYLPPVGFRKPAVLGRALQLMCSEHAAPCPLSALHLHPPPLCTPQPIDYEGFCLFMKTYLEADVPEELCQHLFTSFKRKICQASPESQHQSPGVAQHSSLGEPGWGSVAPWACSVLLTGMKGGGGT